MLNRFLIVVFTIVALFGQVTPAPAAVRFALRGDSLTPRYGLGGKKNTNWLAPATILSPPVVASLADASVFGGQAIDFRLLGDTRGQMYRLGESWINGSNVFSLLIRIVPDWTGIPPFANRVVKTVAPTVSGDAAGGFYMEIQDNGKLFFRGAYNVDSGGNILTFVSGSALSFTSGVATDIMVTSDGANYYASQDGVEIATGALTDATKNFDNVMASNMLICPYPCDLYVNELVIWDTTEPHVYAARSAFITAADFDGTVSTDPGAANVLTTAGTYTIAGLTKTPTYVAAATGNVKTGVTFGAASALTGTYDGSDRWTCPIAGDLRTGAADLKCNSVSTNLVGTLTVPTLANTKVGIAGDGGVGTYDGSDRWTCPSAGQLVFGFALKCNSTTTNLTGTLDQVFNTFTQATLRNDSDSEVVVSITRGDTAVLNLVAENGEAEKVDLTGAVFTTYLRGINGQTVVIADAAHEAAADQTADKGEFTISLTAANTIALSSGRPKEILTKVVQGSSTTHYRANVLAVLPPVPMK